MAGDEKKSMNVTIGHTKVSLRCRPDEVELYIDAVNALNKQIDLYEARSAVKGQGYGVTVAALELMVEALQRKKAETELKKQIDETAQAVEKIVKEENRKK